MNHKKYWESTRVKGAYRQGRADAIDECRKMCGVDIPHYTNCIGCPLAHFENDFDTTICKLEQLKEKKDE